MLLRTVDGVLEVSREENTRRVREAPDEELNDTRRDQLCGWT